MSWTDERVEKLKRLWADGLTASQIASRINAIGGAGMTRNAVIGKAHRLGLCRRIDSTWLRPNEREAKPKKIRKPALAVRVQVKTRIRFPSAPPAPIEAPIQEGGVSLLEIEQNQCRYPVTPDSATSHRFCGCKAVDGLPYCEGHARLAYRVPDRTPQRTYIPTRGAVGIKHDVSVIKNASEFLDA